MKKAITSTTSISDIFYASMQNMIGHTVTIFQYKEIWNGKCFVYEDLVGTLKAVICNTSDNGAKTFHFIVENTEVDVTNKTFEFK